MKKVISIFIFLYCCGVNSQHLVQTTSDVYKLELNKEAFVDKPLKELLKEIKPEIKTVFVDENYFCFITREQLKKNDGSIDDSVVLFVDVKDYINWQWEKRPTGKETIWSKEDVEKYGNLLVTRIGIINGKD